MRKSLGAALAGEAKRKGVAAQVIRKQYIFTIFLSRIFQDQQAPWVLLGGNALLIRTGGGRFTQDVDLARQSPWPSIQDVLTELRSLSSRPHHCDPFQFELYSITPRRDLDPNGYGAATAKVKATALLGGQNFEAFSIDLTIRRLLDAPVDQVQLKPIIDHETLKDLPSVPTTPIENHLADKICALYEMHGQDGRGPPTRYRDLADIVRIVEGVPFDAARLAIILERESGRRRLELPHSLKPPGPDWTTNFPAAAANFAEYPPELFDLDAALEFAGNCLDGVLHGTRSSGSWDPAQRTWHE